MSDVNHICKFSSTDGGGQCECAPVESDECCCIWDPTDRFCVVCGADAIAINIDTGERIELDE